MVFPFCPTLQLVPRVTFLQNKPKRSSAPFLNHCSVNKAPRALDKGHGYVKSTPASIQALVLNLAHLPVASVHLVLFFVWRHSPVLVRGPG